jgi:hypothetical protein
MIFLLININVNVVIIIIIVTIINLAKMKPRAVRHHITEVLFDMNGFP